MAELQFATLDGGTTTISEAAMGEFSSGLHGDFVKTGDAGYDESRTIWNAMIDRHPGGIVRCAGVADVMRSVRFAHDHSLLLSIRGGGHNIAGKAVCDAGLMIDLSAMKSVRVDPANSRARVEPGARLADYDHETQAFGLATPLGINSTTGVAGLTMGGGFGWLSRKYGMTVDSLVSADMVTADGEAIVVSQDSHPDLFWAIRGGGGNFGVVTSFEFRLHNVGPNVLAGLIVFPLAQAKSVLQQYRDFEKTASDDLSVWTVARKAPPLPFLPAEVHGTEVLVLALLYAGNPEDGEKEMAPLRGFGTPVGEMVGVMPYTAWQQAFDPLLTPGARNYWKTHNFSELDDGVFDAMIEYAGKLPSPHCEIFIGGVGGAAARIAPDATAYSHRDAKFVMNVHGRWETAGEDEAGVRWARDFFEAARPYATGGAYMNFLTEDEISRIPAAYGANYERLMGVKKKYDPDNLFRVNQNIAPT